MSQGAMVTEAVVGGRAVRGFLPEVLGFLAIKPAEPLQIFDPVVSLPGRKVLCLPAYAGGDVRVGIDITGPWG